MKRVDMRLHLIHVLKLELMLKDLMSQELQKTKTSNLLLVSIKCRPNTMSVMKQSKEATKTVSRTAHNAVGAGAGNFISIYLTKLILPLL